LIRKGRWRVRQHLIDEACFLAAVRPTRRCHRLTRPRNEQPCSMPSRACSPQPSPTGAQRRRLSRCLERAREQPGAPSRCNGRGGLPCFVCGTTLHRTVTGRPHHRVTARTASDDAGTIASYDDDPPLGGQASLCTACVLALDRRGVRVHTSRARGARDRPRAAPRPGRRSTSPLQLNRYPQILLRAAPDCDPMRRAGPAASALEKLGAPLVYTAHHTTGRRTRVGSVKRLLNVSRRAHTAVRHGAPGYRASPPTRCSRLGIPASPIEVLSNGARRRRPSRRRARGRRVLFVRRMEREKGALDAVRCCRRSHGRGSAGA